MSQIDPYEHYSITSRSETPLSAISATESFDYADRPIPLVTLDPATKSEFHTEYRVNDEGLDFLKSLQAPVGVVSIAGLARTGKSYLLNRIVLNRKKGFPTSAQETPSAKGLWLWGRPISATTIDGEAFNIIVIDSEGLSQQGSAQDMRIFALCLLLASCFVYNSVGAIDDAAIQNLGFIVNLPKLVQVRANRTTSEGEDYEKHFPSFLWVVRDFGVQLLTPDGDPITAKEYLEKSLMPQKGFTNSVEEKNRVRRLLKHFFAERDCFTMVRPSASEADIQRLPELELEDLRSEFVEQVMILRKKVMNKVKPKKLNGKELSGEMIGKLLESYVGAINGPGVLSVDQAWAVICKTECEKAFAESLEMYSKIMQSSVSHRLPVAEEELRLFHKEAKEAAVEHFMHRSIGEQQEPMERNLTTQLSQRFTALKAENIEESEKQAMDFLTEAYGMVDKRLNNGEFASLSDYVKETKALQTIFEERGPQGPNKRELLLEFSAVKFSEAAQYFLTVLHNEVKVSRQIAADDRARVETELRENKEEMLRQRDAFQRKVTAVESEKAELAALLSAFKEQTLHLKAERDRTERELREVAKQQKTELVRKVEEANNRAVQCEESMKEMERRLFAAESQYSQEKELLQQRITFTEKSLEESSKREKDYSAEVKGLKTTHSTALKEQLAKSESALKALQVKFESEGEKVAALEKFLAEKEAHLEALQAQLAETVKLASEKSTALQVELSTARKLIDTRENEAKSRYQALSAELESTQMRSKSRAEELERKLKSLEDQYKSEQTQWLRDNAVLQQKTDFLELQCQDLKTQLEDQRRQGESLASELRALGESDGKEELETQIQRLRDQQTAEVALMERRLEEQRKKAAAVAEELVERANSLELKAKLDSNEWTFKEKQLMEKLEAGSEERGKLIERIKALEAQIAVESEESGARLKNRVKELEREMEEMQARASREVTSINSKSEESLLQLKTFYELEKTRLEQRLQDEKSRAEQRFTAMVEEYEQKLKEDADLANDQRLDLEDQLEELEGIYNNDTTVLKQQIALDAQKIETMEKHLKELKENLASIHTSHALAVEQQLESFNKERIALLEKVERLASEAASKEKELTTVTYRKEQIESLLAFKEKELEETKIDFALERNSLVEKVEEGKAKWRAAADELSRKKSEFLKENALNAQQIEFHTKKIAELTKAKEDSDRKYAEALSSLKDEKSREMNEAIDKLISEKESLEKRLDQKRRALKSAEQSFARQVAAVEKDRAVTAEKLLNEETKYSELEARYRQDVALLQGQLESQKGSGDSDKVAIQLENEHLKTLASDLQRQQAELASAYERDRALWENKFNFLAAQRDQARTDLIDSQKKFEIALEEVKKKSASEKERLENSSASSIAAVEARYSGQLKETQSTLSARNGELTEKCKTLERDLRAAREQLELERRGRSVDSGTLEDRVRALLDTEQRLTSELELLKKDRDRRISELQEFFQREKDELKSKVSEAEKRTKDMEHMRGQLFLEHEKEKARWAMDKDHITAQKNEAVENAARLQKRNDALLKENEKLRAERPGKLRNPAALGRKEAGKAGINILGASISFQDYLATSQVSITSGDGTRTSGTSPQGSVSGASELSPRPGRVRNLLPRALSPLLRKTPPDQPAFKFEGKDPQ